MDAKMFLKKKKKIGHENIKKKLTLKVAYKWQFGFFFSAALEYSFYRFLYPMICGTISGALMNDISKVNKVWIYKIEYLFLQKHFWSKIQGGVSKPGSLSMWKPWFYLYFVILKIWISCLLFWAGNTIFENLTRPFSRLNFNGNLLINTSDLISKWITK